MSYDSWLEEPYEKQAELDDRLAELADEIHRDGAICDLWSWLPVKQQTTLEELIEVAAVARYEEIQREGTS